MMRRAATLRCVLIGFVLTTSLVGVAEAQAAQTAQTAATSKPATCEFSAATVKQVTSSTGAVKLRDTIEIEMTDHTLIDEARCRGKKIVLFLNGRPLKDAVAFPPTDPRKNSLKFPLRRTEGSREVWTGVLGKPTAFSTKVDVSVGLEDQHPIDSGKRIDLTIVPKGWLAGWVAVLILLGGGFLTLARTTDILRDDGPLPGGDKRRPYSMARTQASWWFFIVIAAYLFIGMITGDFSTSITGTVLILVGISAGTVVSSAFVDASKSNPDAARRELAAKQSLEADVIRLEGEIATDEVALKQESATARTAKDAASAARVAEAAAQTPAAVQIATAAAQAAEATLAVAAARATEVSQRIAVKTAELAEKKSQWRKLSNENEQFIRDILSDANGVNFHRFQMVAWTVVLGIIFVGHVYKELAMPEFSETLLSLMGISAGTYIGLKIPEPTVPRTEG